MPITIGSAQRTHHYVRDTLGGVTLSVTNAAQIESKGGPV
jgi:hypothetical protein